MATRRKKNEQNTINEIAKLSAEVTLNETEVWPRIIQGSHSTRTEYEDGRIDFVTDWEALKRDVNAAIAEYEKKVSK